MVVREDGKQSVKMANSASSRSTFVLSLLLIMNSLATFANAVAVNVPVSSVSDLLVQSALSSLNDNSPPLNTYRSGNLIRAQKLVSPDYVIWKLSLNLEPICNAGSSCPREACTIDLRQDENGVIDLEDDSIQCMYLHPHSDEADAQQSTLHDGGQQQDGTTNGQEPEATVDSFERPTSNASLQLDHEVQTVADGNERPFIAVRATDGSYCAGCPYELNPALPGLTAYTEQVAQSMDDTGRSDYKHKVVSIVRVTRAVPPGSNVIVYMLLLEIGETICLRDKSFVTLRNECPLSTEAPIRLCRVMFEQRPWQQDSRKIVRNNCTDLPDTYEEQTSETTSEPVLTSDSQYASEKSLADAMTRKKVNSETLCKASEQKGPVIEETLEKIVVERPNLQENNVRVFQDKYKEFDEFLKNIDFDGPINKDDKTTTVDPRTAVNEEIIRPKVALPLTPSEEPNSAVRARRSVTVEASSETESVRELAQLAVDELDYIDPDNRRRVLLDVVDWRTLQGDDNIYYITMRVATSNCPESSLECSARSHDEVKICKAQVQAKSSGGPDRVLQSHCFDEGFKKREERTRRDLLGAPTMVSIDDPEIRYFAEKGLRKYAETRENEPFLVEILEATAQVVSGIKYKIKVRLGESTCSKGQQENCALRSDKPVDDYQITVWSQPWKDKGKPEITVDVLEASRSRRSVGMPGGVTSISTDDPKIQEYTKKALIKYSETSDGDNEPYLIEIVESSQQTVSGTQYNIRVKLGESTCPKGTKENCQLKSSGQTNEYLITVWSQPWIDHGNPSISIKLYTKNEKSVAKRSLRGANYSQKMLAIAKELADERAFQRFINDHERTYASEDERNYRYEVFRQNLKTIEELRKNEQGTAIYGATMFADLTPEEFRSRHLGLRPDLRDENEVPLAKAEIPDIELPTEFDWRHRNVVTEVKNQGACGSCWAFSVTGNVESLYAIKYGKLLSLSEQELVDCDKLDSGCEGGLPDNTYRAIEQLGGLELETDYPYDAADEKCHFDKSKVRVAVASGLNITSNETQMAQWLVQNGPISIGINANAMQFYMGGISHPFKFLCNGDNLDHGVLIVGYGIHTYPIFKKKMPYWIIKNSWGPRWGEQGYYRVYRGDGTCGLNRMATSAVIA